MFDRETEAGTLSDVRQTTNKAWVLGNDRFREHIEQLLDRQAAPRPKGGDKGLGKD
jgi:putative transposase